MARVGALIPASSNNTAISTVDPESLGPEASSMREQAMQPSVDLDVDLVQAKAKRESSQAQMEILRAAQARDEGFGIRPGTDLNLEKGAPLGVRARLGLDQNQFEQFKLLVEQYGAENVDTSDDGRFLLRNQPAEGGGIEDLFVDPVGLDIGDVAEFSGELFPMISGIIAAKFGGKVGATALRRAGSAIGAMAIGGQTVGALQDSIVRGYRPFSDVDVSDITLQRGKLALRDAAFGSLIAGAGKVATKMLEMPGLDVNLSMRNMPSRHRFETATTRAADKLKAQTGIRFELSPAQASEHTLLARLESMVVGRVGAGSFVDRIRAVQNKAENELRRVALGMPRTITDDELMSLLPKADVTGQSVLSRLGTEALRLEGDIAKASQKIQRIGTQEAQQIARVNLATPFSTSQIGAAARKRAVGDFKAFKDRMRARYDAFLSNPAISERNIPANALASAAKKLEKELVPAVEKDVVKKSAVLDRFGNPTQTIKQQTERLESFTPAKVKSFLDELKGLQKGRVSVNDLKKIRTSIDDAVAEGVAIPGTDIHQLLVIKEAVNDSIETALAGMADKTLLLQWKKLSEDFSAGMSRFDKIGIREMLVKQGERGSVGDAHIAESFLGKSANHLDQFNSFKAFFGNNSPEFQNMRELARKKILHGSLAERTDWIDGQLLRSKLSADALHPEIASELFGATKKELFRISDALSKAQGKIGIDDLDKLAQSGTLTAKEIPALIAAEAARAEAYGNKLIKAAANGTIHAEKIKPSDFIRYLTNMDPDDSARIIGLLRDRPELLKSVSQLGVEDIWSKIRIRIDSGEQISQKLLKDVLGTETQQRTWQNIIGNDTVAALNTMVDLLASREKSTAFKGMGKLGGAMDLSNLFLRGEVGSLPDIAGRFLLGVLYSGPFKRAVTNLATSSDRGRFLNSVIASTPFIEAVIDQFGTDGAMPIMQVFREMIEPMQELEMKEPSDSLRKLSAEDFDRKIAEMLE